MEQDECQIGVQSVKLYADAVRRRFFNWVQTSVRLCVSWSQEILGKIRLILKLRDVKICSSFFFVNF